MQSRANRPHRKPHGANTMSKPDQPAQPARGQSKPDTADRSLTHAAQNQFKLNNRHVTNTTAHTTHSTISQLTQSRNSTRRTSTKPGCIPPARVEHIRAIARPCLHTGQHSVLRTTTHEQRTASSRPVRRTRGRVRTIPYRQLTRGQSRRQCVAGCQFDGVVD
jgi:hypothetical protein